MDHTHYFNKVITTPLIRLLLLFSIGLLFHNRVIAQPCLGLGITFSTQEQIDSFPVNYPECSEIAGNVTITGNNITNLDSLIVLTSMWLDLALIDLPELKNLEGLSNLTYIGGNLFIQSCPNLHNLSGLGNVTEVNKGVGVIGNDSIIDLTGLNNLKYAQSIEMWANSNLKNLNGFDSLSVIGEGLHIEDCDSLINLQGLENLDSVGGLLIMNNGSIASLSGLGLSSATIYYCQIINNDNLTDLGGLENLVSVSIACDIVGNSSLESLNGLNNVNILGSLKIYDNPILSNLTGLEDVSSLEYLDINNNSGLNSLSGIDSVSASSITGISIKHNPVLSTCAVQSICNYLLLPGTEAEMFNNAPGCNTQEEVVEECTVGISEQQSATQLSIYPNPFTTSTTIEYELTEPSPIKLTIYNTIGEVVLQADEGTLPPGTHTYVWTPERLSEGLYIVEVRWDEHRVRRKLIVR